MGVARTPIGVGTSGGGGASTLVDALSLYNVFHKAYIYVLTLSPVYRLRRKLLRQIVKKTGACTGS